MRFLEYMTSKYDGKFLAGGSGGTVARRSLLRVRSDCYRVLAQIVTGCWRRLLQGVGADCYRVLAQIVTGCWRRLLHGVGADCYMVLAQIVCISDSCDYLYPKFEGYYLVTVC